MAQSTVRPNLPGEQSDVTVDILDTDEATLDQITVAGVRTYLRAAWFKHPQNAGIGPDGRIYVMNANGGVTTFDSGGNASAPVIGRATWSQGHQHLTVAPSGKLYAFGEESDTLRTFGADGRPAPPTISGLNHPIAAAVDASGTAYVAGAGGVTVFQPNGAQEFSWPVQSGTTPRAIAVDASGNVYVALQDTLRPWNWTIGQYFINGTPYLDWGLNDGTVESLRQDASGRFYAASMLKPGRALISIFPADLGAAQPTHFTVEEKVTDVVPEASGNMLLVEPDANGGNGALAEFTPQGAPTGTVIAGNDPVDEATAQSTRFQVDVAQAFPQGNSIDLTRFGNRGGPLTPTLNVPLSGTPKSGRFAVDGYGNSYVASANAVDVYDSSGAPLHHITGNLTNVRSIAVADNRLFVLNDDAGKQRVRMFGTDGSWQTTEIALAPGETASAICADIDGNLFLAESAPWPRVVYYIRRSWSRGSEFSLEATFALSYVPESIDSDGWGFVVAGAAPSPGTGGIAQIYYIEAQNAILDSQIHTKTPHPIVRMGWGFYR